MLRYCLPLVFILHLSSCSNSSGGDSEKTEQLEGFVLNFYTDLNKRDSDEILTYFGDEFFEYTSKSECEDILQQHYERVGDFETLVIDTVYFEQKGFFAPYYKYTVVSEVHYTKEYTDDTLILREYTNGEFEIFKWAIKW